MTTNMSSSLGSQDENRLKELEAFDNTKLGVKGLVDSGVTQVPSIFLHPPNSLPESQHLDLSDDHHHLIPVIDLLSPRPGLVTQVKEAAAEFGFFQVINHGIPLSLLDRVLGAIKAFHELPADEKVRYYRRGTMAAGVGVGFSSNFDLYKSKAASWRDTLEIRLGPAPVDPNAIPHVCSFTYRSWDTHCILLQDQVGGLQVKHNGVWINLNQVHGALVINIGDLFQMISNDEYISGEHRVIAHPQGRSRVSVVTFFAPGNYEKWYGPLPELVSPNKPALYRPVQFSNYVNHFVTKELRSRWQAHDELLSFVKLASIFCTTNL